MTSVSNASALASLFLRPSMFSKIDGDQDGKVTKDEFVAARPKDISETKAADLYAKIDTEGTNALTEDQLKAGMEANKPAREAAGKSGGGLADSVLSALLNLVQQIKDGSGEDEDDSKTGKADGRLSPADMFAKMDTDSDGTVTKAEFVAARPSGVDEDKATSFYDSIDTANTGSITLAQFQDARPPHQGGHGHPPGPPPADPTTAAATGTDTTATTTTASSTATDALNNLMAAIKAYATSSKIDVNALASTLTSA
ncbi:hypothetical protein sos41_20210 [Alphaproteobacteria bacterium SO-S41]|nr:hypothetical protein sos41_20210 [Alphaproteobacteria bacterium SO-S41]